MQIESPTKFMRELMSLVESRGPTTVADLAAATGRTPGSIYTAIGMMRKRYPRLSRDYEYREKTFASKKIRKKL